jgi:hypothetical protein
VSGGGRYRREHGEEPMVTYRLGPTEETKAALGGCAWPYALQREKRVSAVVASAEENGGTTSSPWRKTGKSGPVLSERCRFYSRRSGDGRVPHHHQVDDDSRQAGPVPG